MKYSDVLGRIGFSRTDMIQFCQVCINSYKGKHGNVVPILTNEKVITINDVNIVIGTFHDWNVICFRGTTGEAEWALNLNAEKMDSPFDDVYDKGCKVHLGFCARFKFVNSWLADYIKILKSDKILFLGHSLGATTANLAADYTKISNPKANVKVITFGSPRVGTLKYRDFHDNLIGKNNSLTIRNKNDIVCRVPTESMGYKHVNMYFWMAKPKWYQKLLHPIKFFRGCAEDHRPTNYMKNLLSEKS